MADEKNRVLFSNKDSGDRVTLGTEDHIGFGWTVVIDEEGEHSGMNGTPVVDGMRVSLKGEESVGEVGSARALTPLSHHTRCSILS